MGGYVQELYHKIIELLDGRKDIKQVEEDAEVREVIGNLYEASRLPELDYDEWFSSIRNEISRREKRRVRFLPKVMRYAAVAVVPLCCVWAVMQLTDREVVDKTVAYERPKNAVILTLSTGEEVSLKEGQENFGKIHTENVIITGENGEGLAYQVKENQEKSVRYNLLDVPVAANYRLQLSDGTVVYLNSETRLKYPEVFVGDERVVFLEGEAYFEVERKENCPFRVIAKDVAIEVLGTHFNVNAYKETQQVATTLAEGAVEVSCGGKKAVIRPGEQAVAGDGVWDVKKVVVRDYIAWKDGFFVFSKMPLEELMKQAYRWYGVEAVFFNEEVKKVTFTGAMDKNLPLEEFFRVIEKVVDVQFSSVKNNQVVITVR